MTGGRPEPSAAETEPDPKGAETEPDPTASVEPATLPPDPEAYDSPRAVQARARGLSAPYIPGGLDPDPEGARREERRNLKLLIAMVVAIVMSGFVLGYIANLLGFPS